MFIIVHSVVGRSIVMKERAVVEIWMDEIRVMPKTIMDRMDRWERGYMRNELMTDKTSLNKINILKLIADGDEVEVNTAQPRQIYQIRCRDVVLVTVAMRRQL